MYIFGGDWENVIVSWMLNTPLVGVEEIRKILRLFILLFYLISCIWVSFSTLFTGWLVISLISVLFLCVDMYIRYLQTMLRIPWSIVDDAWVQSLLLRTLWILKYIKIWCTNKIDFNKCWKLTVFIWIWVLSCCYSNNKLENNSVEFLCLFHFKQGVSWKTWWLLEEFGIYLNF